jgi:hypothetical protein
MFTKIAVPVQPQGKQRKSVDPIRCPLRRQDIFGTILEFFKQLIQVGLVDETYLGPGVEVCHTRKIAVPGDKRLTNLRADVLCKEAGCDTLPAYQALARTEIISRHSRTAVNEIQHFELFANDLPRYEGMLP